MLLSKKKIINVLTWTSVILAITVVGLLIATWYKPDIYPRMQALSADEIASAMRDDEYFAKYGADWVLVTGVIDYIVYDSNEQVLTFKTSGASKVRCRVHNVNLRFRKNVLIQLQATGAHRDGQNVIFDDCRPLGPSPDL
jgi:hypothetical protein